MVEELEREGFVDLGGGGTGGRDFGDIRRLLDKDVL